MWPLSSRVGGGGKALVAGPLKNNFFCGFPNKQQQLQENVDKSWLKQKREKEIEEKELNERRRKKREENEKNYVR